MSDVVAVAGGRTGVVDEDIAAVLTKLIPLLPKDFTLCHGNAVGTDRAAGKWALVNGVAVLTFPIDSNLDGEDRFKAPKNRNARMFREAKPSVLVAFRGGGGTFDACLLAEASGARILDVDIDQSGEFSVWEWRKGEKAPCVLVGRI